MVLRLQHVFDRREIQLLDDIQHEVDGVVLWQPVQQRRRQEEVLTWYKVFTQLNQDQRIRGPISMLRSLQNVMSDPKTRPDDWAFYYNFDQYLYTEPDDPDQGFGLFGRFGWSTGEVNPFETFYSIGLGGRGMLPTRDNDTYGVGYYYMNMSSDLPDFLGLSSEQGVELYYSIEVTPWLHITPDLQIISDPGASSDRDVAIVYGLRAHMTF